MNTESIVVESRSALTEEQISANRAKTHRLLLDSFRHAEHKAFKEHMDDNQVQQHFDGSLAYGIELVKRKIRTMSEVVPTLMILLQNDAKWNCPGRSMKSKITAYHVICSSTGDYHELLQLMIKKLGQTLVNAKDDKECTALIYAVQSANIKCVEILIANGADVNLMRCRDSYLHIYTGKITDSLGPLIDLINLLHHNSPSTSDTRMDIFDLLLNSGADVNLPCNYCQRTPIMYAVAIGNVKCVEKLIEKGAQVHIAENTGCTLWMAAARTGNVDMLKCLIEDNDIEMDSIDTQGRSVLYGAVSSGNIEAVRYLLELGVKLATYRTQDYVEACGNCGTSLSCHFASGIPLFSDPAMRAIADNLPEVVKLIDEHGCQLYKRPEALIYAIRMSRVRVVEYLLRSHKYPVNYEYIYKDRSTGCVTHYTFLMEACRLTSVKIIKLLLEHGADPNKSSCAKTYPIPSVINVAIFKRHVQIIALFIRGGVNLSTKSYYPYKGFGLPFEAAVWENHIYAAEMLLVSGCSRGVQSLYNNQEVNPDMEPEMKELLKEWNVHKNNVLPLQQRCRMVILNHLCPQADQKIAEMPLPQPLIKYLSIPELDDIIETFKRDPPAGIWVK